MWNNQLGEQKRELSRKMKWDGQVALKVYFGGHEFKVSHHSGILLLPYLAVLVQAHN